MNKIVIQYPDLSRINEQKKAKRNQPPTSENRNTTQPNNLEQTLIQEQKVNLENLKRIMNGGKDYLTITKKHRMENS